MLFADIVGSTPLGEQVDPEAMRNALERYFDAMRVIVEGHGGTVEKFVGDALLAVFGIPNVHEDDATRAVRAAVAMREELARLRPELGIELRARIGINSGEVVAGAGDTFATGDTMNVAARLEQYAEPDEILIGSLTQELVSDAVRVERLEPLTLKGKSEPVAAFRLLEVLPSDPREQHQLAPFVGRRKELARLNAEFTRTVQERRCNLVAVTGEPGIGKSRLVRELASALEDDARLLIGRCLSYGDGITYWPLRDVVYQLAGIEPLSELTRILRDDTVAATVAGAIGATSSVATTAEIQWSVRRLLETVALSDPLILVLDDLHWAEPAFLDLVDYLCGFIHSVPLLLVATGRPELLDARPAWRSFALELSALTAAESAELVDGLNVGLPSETSGRVVESAEGNPLFVEQFCAAFTGDGELMVPPSIQALLEARIDQLTDGERAVAERAAIEGRLFHRGAVVELSAVPGGPDVAAAQLSSLVRRGLIHPAESLFAGDDGYRFAHALVREAVYSATPKALRAELHERFADWLGRAGKTGPWQLEEILGYHLEQAYRFRVEVTARDDHTLGLGVRAARLLGAAGRRALGRNDFGAAQNLLERAVAAAPADDRERVRYLLDFADTLYHTSDTAAALRLAERAHADAVAAADDADQARAGLLIANVRGARAESGAAEYRAAADRALEVLGPLLDDRWMARAWQAKAEAVNLDGGGPAGERYELTERFSREALRHARRDGDGPLEVHAVTYQVFSRILGPTPLETAFETIAALRADTETKLAKAAIDFGHGYLLALAGETSEGRRHATAARHFYHEVGDALSYGGTAFAQGDIEIWDEDLPAAAQTLQEGCDILEEIGEDGYRSTAIVCLARVRLLQGDLDQAEALALEGRALGTDDDLANEFGSRLVLAPIHAARGDFDTAETLAREALGYSDPNAPVEHGQAWLVLARILAQAGKSAESRQAAREAVRLFERKGAVVLLKQARPLTEQPLT